ncbi:nucleolar protein 6-like [Diaphorina citri]|uniref:Nucleolar protein 6 n=1 Tax=Diaphorina citri TaxID=121845 RepID=A0A1S4EDX6_DIACI|nr:nucleolar protein 6-like [Diaphorina citri]
MTMSTEDSDDIPTLVPIGAKRKLQNEVCTELGGEYKEGGGEDGSCLIVGIRLNSDACFKLIHRGPEANLPEAAQFRQLWGDKSELRRFKDGTVCEASVWGSNSDPWSVRRVVTREMIVYLLEKRWGLERKEGRGDFVYLANDVDTLIHKQRMLHTGDHLNERYWRKKLTYLSLIASHLTEHRTQLSILSVQYRTTGEPGLYCVSLLVTPEPSVGKKAKLNIIAVPEDKAIKLSRCYPQACNIRSEWLGKQIEGGATPHYNTLLARDMTVRQNYEYIKSSFERGGDNMRHAYLLLCVWLQQRQLSQGRGTLSRFTLSLYLCRLLARKKLNPSMSSYQMLRNVWVQLSSSEDWTSDGTDSEPVTMETYRQYFPVVFVDSTGLYNVTSDMSKDFYLLLKEEAKLAVSCLDDINLDSFRLLFMTPAPFLRQFDHYIW